MSEHSASFYEPGSREEVEALSRNLPFPMPHLWQKVLEVADGFETSYPVSTPPFEVLPVRALAYYYGPGKEEARFESDLEQFIAIASDFEGGFYALDISTLTPDGDCAVARISLNGYEEFRIDSISEFLQENLVEQDFDRFAPFLPLPAPSTQQELKAEIFRAAANGHAGRFQQIVAQGADFAGRDKNGDSILYNAATGGNNAIVEYLLNKGENPNEKTGGGDTPLIAAIRSGWYDIIETLIAHGADVNLKGWDNRSPLSTFKDFYHFANPEIASLLEQAGAQE